ncbi:von Willebrand factor type A domain-containing protein [Luteolibacter algae]|uniref:von Willebrand factor type A domain-containing protein n=1 Tax=Luteolibacter algae TaxID=454151 RepID=A0ABW5D728_9BACT
MKLQQDDPRITAYLLGELSPEETLAVEHAVAAEPALGLVLKEAERTQKELFELFGNENEVLLPRQKNAVLKAAREASRNGKITPLKSHQSKKTNWMMPLAAAAIIAVGIFILTLIPSTGGGRGTRQVATRSVDSLESRENGVNYRQTENDGAIMNLPLEAGKRSLSLITQTVREKREMPAPEDVRIEELLNAFPLRAKEAVALWKHCSLGAEIMPCPWKPSSKLIFVSVKGSREREVKISVNYIPDEKSVTAYRLLGYANGSAATFSGAKVSSLSAGADTYLGIIVETNDTELGKLTWTVDDAPAPEIPLDFHADKEPSDDARFAALICSYGLWLRGEKSGMLDESLMLGLAREVAGDSLVPDRYDFLELVDETVRISGK